jgi:hypothetical protein
MKRIHRTFLALSLLVLGFAAPVPAATAYAASPPAVLELALDAMPLAAAAAVEAPETAAVELPGVPSNPADWFTETAVLAAVIAAVVALLKNNFLKDLTGLNTVIASLITGAVLSVLGTFDLPFFGQLHDRSLLDALLFGLQSAVIASGGWDVIKGLIGLGKARAPAEA